MTVVMVHHEDTHHHLGMGFLSMELQHLKCQTPKKWDRHGLRNPKIIYIYIIIYIMINSSVLFWDWSFRPGSSM